VPEAFNDTEFDWLLRHAILPVIRHLRPQAIMLQCGADALEEDPLSRLALSNASHRAAVAAVMPLAPRLILLGGGGYNPWSVARCWAGVWAVLNRLPIPPRIPPAAEAMLRGLNWSRSAGRNPPEHWFTTIADTPRPGPLREETRRLAAVTLADLPDPPETVASSAA
jgi:acetoin utilization protein AcuC